MARHAFLSFVVEDLDLVRMFRGQARNKNSNLSFDDYSVHTPFNSSNAEYIRGQIAEKIRNASVTVCLIGRTTHTSAWVKWEIEKSVQLGKSPLGVRLHSDARDVPPPALVIARARIVNWDIDAIVKFIGAV
jgi:hypothetical protein